jgi:hypothetical protein
LSLRAVTLWARSPSSRVAFHSSGPRRVREATYLVLWHVSSITYPGRVQCRGRIRCPQRQRWLLRCVELALGGG